MLLISVNAGSSSLKFTLFEMPEERVIINGCFERIGIGNSFYTLKLNGEKIEKKKDIATHEEAVNILLNELLELKIINNLNEINGIGHRVVHGGSKYSESILIDNDVMKTIDELSELAPLHNPANLTGIKSFKEVLPDTPAIAVFDTAFHQTMDETSFIYPLPYEWYTKYGVRKYGFHGTSHKYVTNRISKLLKRDNLKVISCHIGNGGSIAAIKDKKSIDTTMGFTPNAGVMMGSRCGDIDFGIIPYIMKKENLSLDEVIDITNKKSGLLGVSGISSDSRDVYEGVSNNNERCVLATEIMVKRIVAYISEYNTLLGGADVITFTAGLGENAFEMRRDVVNKLGCLGVYLDEEKNNVRGLETVISTPDSKIQVFVIPTNEELMIARETLNLIEK